MSIRKVIVASASVMGFLSVLGAPAWSKDEPVAKAGQCEPRIVSAQTHFPKDAQDRGQGGTVRVQVVLDKEGHVTQSQVTQSSGSRALDRAAQASVSQDWRFEVSHCIAAALPVTQEVNVVYKRVPTTFSASVNRRGIQFAKLAAENDQCAVVRSEKDSESVISCINRATPGGIAASGLATR
jgi:TonB family protein